MKDFHFTLNCQAQAKDREEALVIAEACKAVITAFHDTSHLRAVQPYKVTVDIDDVEEA